MLMWRSEELILSSMKKGSIRDHRILAEAFKGCQLLESYLQMYLPKARYFSKAGHSDQHTLSDTSSLC